MKKTLMLLSSLVLLISLGSPVFSQTNREASPSSEPEVSIIKDNVKKRIESVVKGQHASNEAKTAFTGALVSVANETLTIKTRSGIKLASVSDNTSYVDQATSKAIKLEDIGIEDYISILGYLTESGVLEARRIILSKEPEQPEYTALFGFIDSIDEKEEIITVTKPQDSQLIEFTTNKNSVLENQLGSEKIAIDFEDLLPNHPVLIIYDPSETDDKPQIISKLLVHNLEVDAETTPSETAISDPELKKLIPTGLQ